MLSLSIQPWVFISLFQFILNLYFGNKDYIHVVIVNSTLSSKDWIFMAKYNLTNLQFEWHKYKFDSPLSFHKRQIPQKRDFLHINWFFSSCVTCSLNQQVFLFRGKVLTGLLESGSLSSWPQSHFFNKTKRNEEFIGHLTFPFDQDRFQKLEKSPKIGTFLLMTKQIFML